MIRIKTLGIILAPLFAIGCASSSCPIPQCATCPNCHPELVNRNAAIQAAPAAGVAVTATASPVAAAPVASSPASIPMVTVTAPGRIYAVPASKMIELVQQAVATVPLNLKSTVTADGVIQTDWKEGYRGNFHILRYWQERTRFRIRVFPDIGAPTLASRLEITEESETRSNEKADYLRHEGIFRPERCQEVLAAIDAKVNALPAAKP